MKERGKGRSVAVCLSTWKDVLFCPEGRRIGKERGDVEQENGTGEGKKEGKKCCSLSGQMKGYTVLL